MQRRFIKSIANLKIAINIFDECLLFDNSGKEKFRFSASFASRNIVKYLDCPKCFFQVHTDLCLPHPSLQSEDIAHNHDETINAVKNDPRMLLKIAPEKQNPQVVIAALEGCAEFSDENGQHLDTATLEGHIRDDLKHLLKGRSGHWEIRHWHDGSMLETFYLDEE